MAQTNQISLTNEINLLVLHDTAFAQELLEHSHNHDFPNFTHFDLIFAARRYIAWDLCFLTL